MSDKGKFLELAQNHKTLQQLFDLEQPVEQTCPENHPFNFQDGYMCCAVQPNVEGDCPQGANGSNCKPRYPDTGVYTCADHPTAVRKGIFYFLRSKHFFIVKNLKTSQF